MSPPSIVSQSLVWQPEIDDNLDSAGNEFPFNQASPKVKLLRNSSPAKYILSSFISLCHYLAMDQKTLLGEVCRSDSSASCHVIVEGGEASFKKDQAEAMTYLRVTERFSTKTTMLKT